MEPKKGLADPLKRLERIIGLLRLLSGTRIETGNLTTPSGVAYKGFKVTIVGGITDPATIERTYEDIENILRSNRKDFKTHEEKTPSGLFKSYIVET